MGLDGECGEFIVHRLHLGAELCGRGRVDFLHDTDITAGIETPAIRLDAAFSGDFRDFAEARHIAVDALREIVRDPSEMAFEPRDLRIIFLSDLGNDLLVLLGRIGQFPDDRLPLADLRLRRGKGSIAEAARKV